MVLVPLVGAMVVPVVRAVGVVLVMPGAAMAESVVMVAAVVMAMVAVVMAMVVVFPPVLPAPVMPVAVMMPVVAVAAVAAAMPGGGGAVMAVVLRRGSVGRGRRVAHDVRHWYGNRRGHAHDRGEHVCAVRGLGPVDLCGEDAGVGAHHPPEAGQREHRRRRQRDPAENGVHRHDGSAEPGRRDHAARSRDHP